MKYRFMFFLQHLFTTDSLEKASILAHKYMMLPLKIL